jgi:putative tricarboxylic transport membrane protein
MNLSLYTAGLQLFDLNVLMFMILGVLLGLIVGALPGLTATMGVSILGPHLFPVPTAAILMLWASTARNNYAGSISATWSTSRARLRR